MDFRKDINGLRAIAVVSVLIFHFNESYLSGGFSGVDIFFVISGFLMTSIIFNKILINSFSLKEFVYKRSIRIIPPLLFLIFILLALGYFFVIPMDYKELSKHALGSIFFYSNYIFFKEINYFDVLVNQKWLLHTWSLCVEWQFYICYALLLHWLVRYFELSKIKKWIVISIPIFFVINLYLSKNNAGFSFYLLPSRIWEMLIGALAFIYPLNKETSKKVRFSIQILGLVLITLSFFLFNSKTSWPGYNAILPVIGTYFVILSNCNNVLLNNRLVQKIGRQSYSLYLWHWPILVSIVYLNLDFSMLTKSIFYLTLSFGFTFLSYHMLESKKLAFLPTSIMFFFITILSFFIYKSQGVGGRVPEEFALNSKEYHQKFYGGSAFPANEPVVLGEENKEVDMYVIGDSFGHQYAKFLDIYGKEKKLKFLALFDHGCLIFKNYTRFLNGKEDASCSSEYEKLKKMILIDNKPIVLSYQWDGYINLLGRKNSNEVIPFEGIDDYSLVIASELLELEKDFGDRNYSIVSVPQATKELGFSCISRSYLIGAKLLKECTQFRDINPPQINSYLKSFSEKNPNFNYIESNNALCDKDKCRSIISGKPIFSDYSHLSIYGAEIVGQDILKSIFD